MLGDHNFKILSYDAVAGKWVGGIHSYCVDVWLLPFGFVCYPGWEDTFGRGGSCFLCPWGPSVYRHTFIFIHNVKSFLTR